MQKKRIRQFHAKDNHRVWQKINLADHRLIVVHHSVANRSRHLVGHMQRHVTTEVEEEGAESNPTLYLSTR